MILVGVFILLFLVLVAFAVMTIVVATRSVATGASGLPGGVGPTGPGSVEAVEVVQFTMSGNNISSTGALRLTLLANKVVNLSFMIPSFTTTGTPAQIIAAGVIPVGFRPATSISNLCPTVAAGTRYVGLVTVTPVGDIVVFPDQFQTGATFWAAANNIVVGAQLTYPTFLTA